jgi:hypothetical protein
MAAMGWMMATACLGTHWHGSGCWLAVDASAFNRRALVGIGEREREG